MVKENFCIEDKYCMLLKGQGKILHCIEAKFLIAALSGPATCRTGPIRQLAGPDRSETQSFSIDWSNILPVI